MFNLFFLRYMYLRHPIEKLTQAQRDALAAFRAKMNQGAYVFEDSACLCGARNDLLVARRDRYALPVNTYLCRNCGLLRTSPRMDASSLARFYEEDYRPIYVGQSTPPESYFINQIQNGQEIFDFLESVVHFWTVRPLTVFDVGCGAGGTLIPFREAGWNVFGCDIGQKYTQRGRDAGLVLEHGDASALEKYGPANLVILRHVLEHLLDPLQELRVISESLADDGYVYIEVPGIFSIDNTYGDFLLFLQNAHMYHFTLATISSLMGRSGFRLIKGNETIRAVFQKDRAVSTVFASDEYKKTQRYLMDTEMKRVLSFYRDLRNREKLIRIARRCLGDSFVDNIKARLRQTKI